MWSTVGRDPLALVELDADPFQPEPLHRRTAPDGDEHQVGVDRLAVAELDPHPVTAVVDPGALLLEVQRDPALLELLRELVRRVVVLGRDELRQHLDDRDLGTEAAEDRRELAADDPAAQHHEPARDLRLREQAGGVDAARRVEARNRRRKRKRPRGDDRRAELHVLPALDRDSVRVLEASRALHPLDAVRLEQRRDAARHLLDDAGLPLVGGAEVELRLADLNAELRERLLGLLDRERRLHPCLGRDAPDAQAGPAELGLLLDADRLRAELGGADRSGVPTGAAPEDGDVTFHLCSSSRLSADPIDARRADRTVAWDGGSDLSDHRRRVPSLVDGPEAEALVEPDRGVVLLHAEAQAAEAVLLRARDQRLEHLLAQSPPAPAGNDRDRQLRSLLVDEAVTRLVSLE